MVLTHIVFSTVFHLRQLFRFKCLFELVKAVVEILGDVLLLILFGLLCDTYGESLSYRAAEENENYGRYADNCLEYNAPSYARIAEFRMYCAWEKGVAVLIC